MARAAERVSDQRCNASMHPDVKEPVALSHDVRAVAPLHPYVLGKLRDVVGNSAGHVFVATLQHADFVFGPGETKCGHRAAISGADDDNLNVNFAVARRAFVEPPDELVDARRKPFHRSSASRFPSAAELYVIACASPRASLYRSSRKASPLTGFCSAGSPHALSSSTPSPALSPA